MLLSKVAIITGATTGIGAATAVEFAKQGARLVLHGRNKDGLKKTKESCLEHGLKENDVAIAVGDLVEETTVDVTIKTAIDTFGRVDILFHNAGGLHAKDGPINTTGDVTAMDYQYNIFVRAPYLLTQKLIPELVKSKGTVIFNSSTGALGSSAIPHFTGICVMKAGQDQMMRTLSLSLAKDGVRVNSVNPGIVATELGIKVMDQKHDQVAKMIPLEQTLTTPEEIVKTVVFLASDQSSCLTGVNIVCDRGYTLTHPFLNLQTT